MDVPSDAKTDSENGGHGGTELPLPAEFLLELTSQATKALLLSHRAVRTADPRLVGRAVSSPRGSVATPPRHRLRERFCSEA